jgi:hypothetical protein
MHDFQSSCACIAGGKPSQREARTTPQAESPVESIRKKYGLSVHGHFFVLESAGRGPVPSQILIADYLFRVDSAEQPLLIRNFKMSLVSLICGRAGHR